ncbi:MAG: sugar transferase [Crocinitomicaceae bacterium]|nr:sugar transferase [Flavobacteriales bacterium]NQZ37725.1 sugar transferase [Crocinitomicaceae bacterium]PHR31059.1 MAG: polyprenyl glycosylphosphotransferase [Fluviicola sp.]
MNARLLTFLLVLVDWLSAVLAWGSFYYVRKVKLELTEFNVNESFYYGVLFIPIAWIFLYTLQGTYLDVRRLHRIKIFNLTFVGTVIGVVMLFFVFLLDDEINGYKQYYTSVFLLFAIHFSLSFLPRLFLVSNIVKRIHRRKAGFRTMIIGGSERAIDIYDEIESLPKGTGNKFVGFINLNGVDRQLEKKLTYLGHINDVEAILRENEIEQVIIAVESVEHDRLRNVISRLEGGDVKIKILPDMYDILSGTVKMNNIFGALLIEVKADVMPIWQRITKRIFDVTASAIALVLLTPVFIVLGVLVKTSSPGPILFFQQRIGKNGVVFNIIKFRTMVMNAEKAGPQLSSSNDPRITSVGRFMRKSRLDEFPQFWNVLVGDMSLVGPRPERQFYIDQIAEIEPQFHQLTKVRPGITSWGQVKYGYAENVDQMLDRMKFDLLYLKNRTLSLDFKIMLYTILIIFKGAGK